MQNVDYKVSIRTLGQSVAMNPQLVAINLGRAKAKEYPLIGSYLHGPCFPKLHPSLETDVAWNPNTPKLQGILDVGMSSTASACLYGKYISAKGLYVLQS